VGCIDRLMRELAAGRCRVRSRWLARPRRDARQLSCVSVRRGKNRQTAAQDARAAA
jgi:hypothetical protein